MFASARDLLITNVHLADDAPHQLDLPAVADGLVHSKNLLWDICCIDGKVYSIVPASSSCTTRWRARLNKHFTRTRVLNANGRGILLPSLCHPHIHIDTCFQINGAPPNASRSYVAQLDYMQEQRYCPPEMLVPAMYARAKSLVSESIACGVTAIRAFVNVDSVARLYGVFVALLIKREFQHACDVQVAALATEPLYAASGCELPDTANFAWFKRAMELPGVDVVASAPHYELDYVQQCRNMAFAILFAKDYRRHLDLHLNLDLDNTFQHQRTLLTLLPRQLDRMHWPADLHVTVGHPNAHCVFLESEWRRHTPAFLQHRISFVGTPPTDLYLLGRNTAQTFQPALGARATMPLPYMARLHLPVAMGVGHVGNAFAPQESVDPLALCPLAVAVYQDSSDATLRTLLESVSVAAKAAIAVNNSPPPSLRPQCGDIADFVLLHDNDTLRDAALRPSYARTTIRAGIVVASRTTTIRMS